MKAVSKQIFHLEKTLFFFIVLLLPTQLGKHFWPSFSSIFSLRLDYLSPVIYFWDLLALLLTGLFIFNLKKHKAKLNKTFLFISLLFLLSQSLSIPGSINPLAGLVRLKDYSISLLFALYISSQTIDHLKQYFFPAFSLAILVSCVLGIFQFLLGRSLGFWILGERTFNVTTPLIARFTFYEDVFLRPYATFPHPNLLAGFLIISLPLFFLFLPQKLKSLKIGLTLLIFATIFITFSRPALGIAFILIFYFFQRFWKLLLIFSVVTLPLIFVRLSSIFTFDSLALIRRQELSDYALLLFNRTPVFGVGLNNFLNHLAYEKILVGSNRFLQPVHNIFLLTASETGVVGLVGFLILISTAFLKNINSKSPLSSPLISSLLILLVLGLFDHYFLTLPQGQRLLFLIIGLSFIKHPSKKRQKKSRDRPAQKSSQ